jgi:hypothetical protein
MTRLDALWPAIRRALHTERWVALSQIYRAVEASVTLDAEDHMPDAPGSTGARWKRNVRNVLQSKKVRGDVKWDARTASYKL